MQRALVAHGRLTAGRLPHGLGLRLEVRDLTKRFGANVAVDGLSFKATPGRVLAFLRLTGAGKTTTLRMVLGLTLPTSGTATVEEHPYRELEGPRSAPSGPAARRTSVPS